MEEYIYLKLNAEHILLQPSVVLQPPTCFVCKEHTYSNWNLIYKYIDENQPHTHTGIVCGTIYIYICMFGENSIYIYIYGGHRKVYVYVIDCEKHER